MGNDVQTFEVRVEVRQKGSRHFSSHVGRFIENTMTKMFHIDARTRKQALQKAEKHGRPISARKADVERMSLSVERMPLGASNPYPNAIAMDEFIWKRKGKRQERRNNNSRDGNGY